MVRKGESIVVISIVLILILSQLSKLADSKSQNTNVTGLIPTLSFDRNTFERKQELILGNTFGGAELIPVKGAIEKINESDKLLSNSSKPVLIEAFQEDKLFFRKIAVSDKNGNFSLLLFVPQDGSVKLTAQIIGDNSTEAIRTISVVESPFPLFLVAILLCIAIGLVIIIIFIKPEKHKKTHFKYVVVFRILVAITSAALIIIAAVTLFRFQPSSVAENSGIIAVLLTPILGLIINYIQTKAGGNGQQQAQRQ